MKKIISINLTLMICISSANSQTIKDFDGNTYNVIEIGTQTWLKENLKVTHYNNGDLIDTTLSPFQDIVNQMPYEQNYQWCYNGDINNIQIYGRLYSWFTITDSRKICPISYRLPNDSDWQKLIDNYGGDSIAGAKLKSNSLYWIQPNIGSSSANIFSAEPGGYRNNNGFAYIYYDAIFWSTDQIDYYGSHFALSSSQKSVEHNFTKEYYGFSIRCMKDNDNIIDGISRANDLVYPNPVNSVLFIKNSIQKSNLSVYNLMGELLYKDDLNENKIDFSGFEDGIYILVITNIVGTQKKVKILKQHTP